MEQKNKVDHMLAYFQSTYNEDMQFDRVAIDRAYSAEDTKHPLIIKILSVFGGLLASIVFFGFLFLTGLYESKTLLLAFSALAIAAGLLVSRNDNGILWDTMSVALLAIGFIMLSFGLTAWDMPSQQIPLVLIVVAAACLALAGNYMICFVSTLILHGSILAYIIGNHWDQFTPFYLCGLVLLLSYIFLDEAALITRPKSLLKWYNPVKTALIFAFFSGLITLRVDFPLNVPVQAVLFTSGTCIILILFNARAVLNRFAITKSSYLILTYALILLSLIPTAVAPGIAGSLLILLLCFQTNYKTGFIIAAIALIYFIGQCYYDLRFTLLTKSLLLFASGTFFIILYLFISKRHDQHKKI
ncbi:DUF4401 domain-containing protein [Sphingobacterium paludis]|uniref:Uncharacterized protein DUF4401 n=1 Tax=Sphingobacterium paludis TaxID=1476465 RepID=A0A4R7D0M9_9SPHI|nr:DUF4401 domain-containing protein [Sphingobacterium paludis]TDS12316.1 uncharacterized protein DUF4401 [Sphingobacterium paludis]